MKEILHCFSHVIHKSGWFSLLKNSKFALKIFISLISFHILLLILEHFAISWLFFIDVIEIIM
jgi:hypothetical protein